MWGECIEFSVHCPIPKVTDVGLSKRIGITFSSLVFYPVTDKTI